MCGDGPTLEHEVMWDMEGASATDRWKAIVGQFYKRSFTNESDKLLALSSLAKTLAPQFPWPAQTQTQTQTQHGQGHDGPAYIAGLWRSDLLQGGQQLAWRLHYNYHDELQPPSSYIAPSFSWASINFIPQSSAAQPTVLLTMEQTTYNPLLCEVVDVGRELVFPGSEFGAISSAFLTLRGPLLPCALEFHAQHQTPQLSLAACAQTSPAVEISHWERDILFDCPLSQHTLENGDKTILRSKTRGTFASTDISLLLLGTDGMEIDGLILGRQCAEGYQRLGFVRVDIKKNHPRHGYAMV
jgi:hypothetical protein